MENKVELEMKDVYEADEVENLFEESQAAIGDNVYIIMAEIKEGKELLEKGIEQGTTRQLFNDRDITMLDGDMLAVTVDFKDTFTGDQQVLMGYCKEHLEDVESEINQLF